MKLAGWALQENSLLLSGYQLSHQDLVSDKDDKDLEPPLELCNEVLMNLFSELQEVLHDLRLAHKLVGQTVWNEELIVAKDQQLIQTLLQIGNLLSDKIWPKANYHYLQVSQHLRASKPSRNSSR